MANKEKVELSRLKTEHGQRITPFVGRTQEMARLQELFERAQQGSCQILFLFGEPGIGKTTLVDRFLDQVRDVRHVLIGRGQSVEHHGSGEAYLPLLEAFRYLCREPGGEQVLSRLRRHAPTWLAQMPGLLKAGSLEVVQRHRQSLNRERMLRELVEVIEALGTDTVLVLALEDLQWSDPSTLDVVAYLAQRQLRLYLVGTYRPAEVVVSRHPLRQVMQELSGRRQCEELALELFTEADVEEYLRQRFGQVVDITGLSRMIYRRTDGNALFIVSFVDYLLQHELLIEAEGQLVLATNLGSLRRLVPSSLQQTILRQIERLTPEEQHLLSVASVGGMTFTAAEVVERTRRTLEEIEEIYDHLASRELIITVVGISEWPDGTVAVQYRFRHALYQEVLYEQLGQGQRIRLHQQLGERKEAGYGERAREIAPELAVHFTEGRDYGRAVQYYGHASETALRRGTYGNAIAYCQEGLDLLERLPETAARQRQELALRMFLYSAAMATQGYGVEAMVPNLLRARELCQALSDDATLVPVLVGLGRVYDVGTDCEACERLSDEILDLLQRVKDPTLALQLHTHLGTSNLLHGELGHAQEHHTRALELYDSQSQKELSLQSHKELSLHFGVDPAAVAGVFSSWGLWLTGWPDRARTRLRQSLNRVEELDHIFSRPYAIFNAAQVPLWCGDLDDAERLATESLSLGREYDLVRYSVLGEIVRTYIQLRRGEREAERPLLVERLSRYRTLPALPGLPLYFGLVADAYGQLGRVGEGLVVVAEALRLTETEAGVFWIAELQRVKGELVLRKLQDSDSELLISEKQKVKSKGQKAKLTHPQSSISGVQAEEEAEACFLKAVAIARVQQAKSLELRATVSLARLWQQQEKYRDAHKMLSTVYGWFTEGFDTRDLQEARALLYTLQG
jgi:tetratricopeptide (TPR) repeat protein